MLMKRLKELVREAAKRFLATLKELQENVWLCRTCDNNILAIIPKGISGTETNTCSEHTSGLFIFT